MNNTTQNAFHLAVDLIQGDERIAERKDFSILSPEEIHRALSLITSNKYFSDQTKKYLLTNTWKINYKEKPPTIEEFLTEKWLGDTANSLFPYIKNALIAFFNPTQSYRNLILFWPIGSGKSFLVSICNLYIAVIIYLMRNPRKTLGLNASAILCNVFMAFSLDKATEVLLAPFKEILQVAENKFEKCRTYEQMLSKEKEYGSSKICWTTASNNASALTFGSNMSFKIKSSSASLLGLTILCGAVTELTFFKEAGFSDEEIMKLYNDLKGRIFSRFPDAFWAKSILDSSPNDASYESSIDYWILNTAPKQLDPKTNLPVNLILQGKKWDLQPWNFPEWNKDNTKTFPMFTGGKDGKLPKIIQPDGLVHYAPRDIIQCPIDTKLLAEDDPIKFLKDYAGIPSGASNRLIYDNTKIEAIFTSQLHNLYSHITALDFEEPEHLIWNKMHGEFFIDLGKGRYEFYRNPLEERFLSVDQSITGDTAGLAVTHPEFTEDGEIMDVVDMTIALIPHKGRINLDAIKFFIYDLVHYGRMNIKHVSFDRFNSEPTIQFLKRMEIETENLSVDQPVNAYLSFIQSIQTGRIKSGKNIYLKNNLKSLKMSKTPGGKPKIDHELGKVENSLSANDNWETSSLGFNAKDIADAVCASIELRKKYFTGCPRYIYHDEKESIIKGAEPLISKNSLLNKYKLIIRK